MSEINALAQKLMTLISDDVEFEAGARVVSRGGVPDPITAILDEIDNTVLERNLEFSADANTVNLIAGGRRLRGVLAVSPESHAHIVGKTLSREEPELVQATSALLSEMFGGADRLTVRSLASEPFGEESGERGISARRLAELWEQDADETPKSPMERFLKYNASALKSVMHVNKGEIISTVGDFSALQGMWNNQVMEFRKTNKNMLTGKEGPQLICLEGALDDGSAAALVIADNEIALMAYEPDKLSAMQSSWRGIFG